MNKKPFGSDFPLYDRRNYILLGIGMAMIAIGYLCLGWKPKDGTLTMVVAPVLLVAGYCIMLPWAFFAKSGKIKELEKKSPSA